MRYRFKAISRNTHSSGTRAETSTGSKRKIYVTVLAARVMAKAWDIAKEAQRMRGGTGRQYLKEALQTAWNLIKSDRGLLATAAVMFGILSSQNNNQRPAPMNKHSRDAAYYAACW